MRSVKVTVDLEPGDVVLGPIVFTRKILGEGEKAREVVTDYIKVENLLQADEPSTIFSPFPFTVVCVDPEVNSLGGWDKCHIDVEEYEGGCVSPPDQRFLVENAA